MNIMAPLSRPHEEPGEYDHLDGDGELAWLSVPLIGLFVVGVLFAAFREIVHLIF